MALERTAVYATARQPGLSVVAMSFAFLLSLAFAALLISSAHAGWAGSAASQQFGSVETVYADVVAVDAADVHQGHVSPGGLACPGAAGACCSIICGAVAHMTDAPDVPVLGSSARLTPLRSQAVKIAWQLAAFRPPIS